MIPITNELTKEILIAMKEQLCISEKRAEKELRHLQRNIKKLNQRIELLEIDSDEQKAKEQAQTRNRE